MGTIFVDNLEPQSGTSLTLGASGDTVNLGSGGTVYNTPAFQAKPASTLSVTGGTITKVAMSVEEWDTNSDYDTSNYRFTPTVAGKYLFYLNLDIEKDSPDFISRFDIYLYKNGSEVTQSRFNLNSQQDVKAIPRTLSYAADMNGSTDYMELYALTSQIGTDYIATDRSYFGAYRLIGA